MILYWHDASAEIARGDSTIQALASLYRDEAKRVLDTGGILFPRGHDVGDTRILSRPPGYSLIMAAATATFGDPDTPLRLAQILLAAAQAGMVVLIAAELLPVGLAIIAGLIAAFSPHLAYYSIFLSPDSLAVFPILIAVYLIIRASKRPRLITIIAAGTFIGLSCWLRANALFLAIFLSVAVLFLCQRDRRLRYALAVTVASFLVIAPITLRNWIAYGRFIPISLGSGTNLVEGIGEYDKQGRFGLPILDGDLLAKEVEWYGRPDYKLNLYVPDGIERDRARRERGLAVVRSNPGWFTGVMLRRMVFMLRYNDFRFENPSFNTPVAPAVLASPNFGHALTIPEGMAPAWATSMAEAVTERAFVAPEAEVTIIEQDQTLQITGDSSETRDQFITAPITVQKGTDYILALQVKGVKGPLSARVRTADPRIILAASRIPETRRKRKESEIHTEASSGDLAFLHFASGDGNEVRLVIANNKMTASERADSDRPVVQLGRADLVSLGPTPYRWTRYLRTFIRGIQKNLYKTEWMWFLVFTGAGLLLFARRWQALLILLAVPAYYLIVHSVLHVEYRYILAVHYFLFICAAATLYIAWMTLRLIVISDRPYLQSKS